MSVSGAAAFRKAMTEEYRKYEKLLGPDQEAVATFVLPSREIRLRVSQVGSSDDGILNIFGVDENGSPVDIFMYYTQLCYFLEAVTVEKPRRIGFTRSDD